MFVLLGMVTVVGALIGRLSRSRAAGPVTIPAPVAWLLGGAVLMWVSALLAPSDAGSALMAVGALLAGLALVVVTCSRTVLRLAAAIALVGSGMNIAVMLANGGMPVSSSAAEHVGAELSSGEDDQDARHLVMGDDPRLALLGDIIPVDIGFDRGVVSVGDLVLLAAAARAARDMTRRGSPAPPTSPLDHNAPANDGR